MTTNKISNYFVKIIKNKMQSRIPSKPKSNFSESHQKWMNVSK